MPIIEWNKSMSVNIDEIDLQHQHLVKTIQKLEDSMSNGQSQIIVKEVLDELNEYLDIHFKTEERIFKIINYPEAESHRKEHSNFILKVTKFKNDYVSGSVGLATEMMNFLCDWGRNHMKKEDKKYAEFIANQQQIH